MELMVSQCGSNGSTSVITCTSRSCDTANEHSVKNVALALTWLALSGECLCVCDLEKTLRETSCLGDEVLALRSGRISTGERLLEALDLVGESSPMNSAACYQQRSRVRGGSEPRLTTALQVFHHIGNALRTRGRYEDNTSLFWYGSVLPNTFYRPFAFPIRKAD